MAGLARSRAAQGKKTRRRQRLRDLALEAGQVHDGEGVVNALEAGEAGRLGGWIWSRDVAGVPFPAG